MANTSAHRAHPTLPRDRFRGCLLGGAVGDALGAPVEFMSHAEILDRFGPGGITGYAPAYGGLGRITDDTQMTLFTAEGLLQGWAEGCASGSACLVRATHRAYLRWLRTQDEDPEAVGDDAAPDDGWLVREPRLHSRRGPGTTCLAALQAAGAPGTPASNDRKGCGGVMRVAPVGLFLWRPSPANSLRPAFALASQLAGLTHGHPTGQLAAGVLAVLVQALLEGLSLEAALAAAREILVTCPNHQETLSLLEQAGMLARSDLPRAAAVTALGQGWLAEEALAIAVYCALVAESFADGVVLAVNHDGDSDSTGAMAGQLLGAQHGLQAIPAEWLAALELGDVIADTADRLAQLAGPGGLRPGGGSGGAPAAKSRRKV
jgi:ADP-ribosylglycohydrolase